ncbi:MAG: LysM peptidoglycan-binding domain-containing protein, partial [Pseudomonadota bacterium]
TGANHMVGIVSGNSLGLDLTSGATLGQRGQLGQSALGQSAERSYVNVATGNLVVQQIDDFLVSNGLDVAALRTYNSQGLMDDDNADNWSNGFYRKQLQFTGAAGSTGTVTRTGQDGSQAVYTYDALRSSQQGKPTYVTTAGAGAYDMISYAANRFTWTDGDSGISETYTINGTGEARLTSATDHRGAATSYEYSTSGLISKVTGGSGEAILYDYNQSSRRLMSVRYVAPSGAQTAQVSFTYDANGYLIEVDDQTLDPNDRKFVNDVNGRVLYAKQGNHIQRQLIVNGEVLGRYGEMVSNTERNSDGSPVFTTRADFNFGYQATGGNTPDLAMRYHTVGAGDTLEAIAKNMYGDARLWFRIAEANGMTSNADLKAGQLLKIPGAETSANSADTFRTYRPGEIVGDTSPNMPAPPPKKASMFGQLLMIIIVVILTVYTAGAMAAAGTLGTQAQAAAVLAATTTGGGVGATMASGMSVLGGTAGAGVAAVAGAAGGAAGSVGGQLTGMALGVQSKIDWDSVVLSAISGGISGGLTGIAPLGGAPTSISNVMARSAMGNAITQGVGVATGLQDKFNWKSVAASAAAAGVGQGMNAALSDAGSFNGLGTFSGHLARGTVSGFAAGTTAALMRGGKIAVQQVAVDAFGNALGYSLADIGGPSGSVQLATDAQQNAFVNAVNAYSHAGAGTTYPGDLVAGGDSGHHIARMMGLATDPAPGSSYGDATTINRVVVIGTSTDEPLPPSYAGDLHDPTGNAIPTIRLPDVFVRERGMTQAEKDEYDLAVRESNIAAMAAKYGSVTAFQPPVMARVWLAPEVQRTMNNSPTGMVLGSIVNTIGSAVASVRSNGYNFATNKHLNPVERRDARIDGFISAATSLIGPGMMGSIAAEARLAQTLRRSELNSRFGRSGNLDLDINMRGASDIQRQVDRLTAEGHAPARSVRDVMTDLSAQSLVQVEAAALRRIASNANTASPWADLRKAYQQARGQVDFQHIEADVFVKANGQVKAQGGHFSTSSQLQRIPGTESVAPNGVIYGQVRLQGPDGNFYLKTNNRGFSTMTPESWSLAQSKAELSRAWATRSFDPLEDVWTGKSGGVDFLFYEPSRRVPIWRGHPVKK